MFFPKEPYVPNVPGENISFLGEHCAEKKAMLNIDNEGRLYKMGFFEKALFQIKSLFMPGKAQKVHEAVAEKVQEAFASMKDKLVETESKVSTLPPDVVKERLGFHLVDSRKGDRVVNYKDFNPTNILNLRKIKKTNNVNAFSELYGLLNEMVDIELKIEKKLPTGTLKEKPSDVMMSSSTADVATAKPESVAGAKKTWPKT